VESEVDADFSSFYLLHSSTALLVVIAKEPGQPRPSQRQDPTPQRGQIRRVFRQQELICLGQAHMNLCIQACATIQGSNGTMVLSALLGKGADHSS
jgi:hypothetical protein